MARKKDSMATFRTGLYKVARIMGDINAVKTGTVHKRIARRVTGRITGKGMKGMFKK